jgi:hypothetical protein
MALQQLPNADDDGITDFEAHSFARNLAGDCLLSHRSRMKLANNAGMRCVTRRGAAHLSF